MSERIAGRRIFHAGIALVAGVIMVAVLGMSAQDMPILSDASKSPAATDIRVPEFDVSSVKVNKSEQHMMRIMNSPSGFSCTNLSLKTLIAQAYGIKQDLISGGDGWVSSTGFDIEGKVAGADVEALKKLSGDQRRTMLKPLLAERFKLKVHTETKVLPIYELVVAKGGPKLTETTAVPPDPDAPRPDPAKMDLSKMGKTPGSMRMGPGELTAVGITTAGLTSNLSSSVHRTVVDKTGLTGKYDFTLKFAPEDGSPASADSSLPSIFTALQEQLGLKLQPAKGDVETLMIDHAEIPAEN